MCIQRCPRGIESLLCNKQPPRTRSDRRDGHGLDRPRRSDTLEIFEDMQLQSHHCQAFNVAGNVQPGCRPKARANPCPPYLPTGRCRGVQRASAYTNLIRHSVASPLRGNPPCQTKSHGFARPPHQNNLVKRAPVPWVENGSPIHWSAPLPHDLCPNPLRCCDGGSPLLCRLGVASYSVAASKKRFAFLFDVGAGSGCLSFHLPSAERLHSVDHSAFGKQR
jgi:hypothetical protein